MSKTKISKNIYYDETNDNFLVSIRYNKRSVSSRFTDLSKAQRWRDEIRANIQKHKPSGVFQFETERGFAVWDLGLRNIQWFNPSRVQKTSSFPFPEVERETVDDYETDELFLIGES